MVDQFEERCASVTYPGRGIICGKSESGEEVYQVYWIMGRSANSRNRRFDAEGGRMWTEAADPSLLEDPSLIIYQAMLERDGKFIVSNGDQTSTIDEYFAEGKSFEDALLTREREPDAPNFTPRISCVYDPNGKAKKWSFSILKANPDQPEYSDRQFFYIEDMPKGWGRGLTTYLGDGDPLPSFRGDLLNIQLKGTAENILNEYWGKLDQDNLISLAVKAIPISGGESTLLFKNKY